MKKLIPIITILISSAALPATASESFFKELTRKSTDISVPSFTTAKNKLYKIVYQNKGETVYTGCSWSNRRVDLASCGLDSFFPKKSLKRAKRTEAEHIIPASWLLKVNGKYRQCAIDAKKVGESARDYCQKHDINYKQAHNDIVNLFPSVGAVNQHRSNKPFLGEVKYKSTKYGKKGAEVSSRGIVPPDDKKGDIARIAKHMQIKYGVIYSARQQGLFDLWEKQDPVSQEETDRNSRVIKAQGYGLFQ